MLYRFPIVGIMYCVQERVDNAKWAASGLMQRD